MRPGRHAAADGSFGRSAGAAGGRGFGLIALALLLGVGVLNATGDDPPGPQLTVGDRPTTVPSGDGDKTTTTVAVTTTTTPARPPGEVKLLVVNGTRTKGAAAKVSDRLRPPGYNVLAPTDGTAADSSSVFFGEGFEREAGAIAQSLELAPETVKPLPTPVPVKGGDIRGANVVVLVGPELVTATSGGAATTTTTKKP